MIEQPDARHMPWPHYAAAVVELVIDGRHIVLTPLPRSPEAVDAPDVSDEPDAPTSLDRSPLARWRPPIMVLTAGDPYPVELDERENEARMRRLCAQLDTAGIEHDPALGRSPDGSTSEVSRALRGVGRTQALEFAARFGQLAIYDIDERIRCVHVASGAVVTEHEYSLRDAAAGSRDLLGPTGWSG
jgi:hypothetical protein